MLYQRITQVFSFSLFCLISTTTYADTWDMTVSGGIDAARLHNNGTVNIDNINTNQYTTSNHTTYNGLAGVGFSRTFTQLKKMPLDLSLGFASYYIDEGKVSGTEYPSQNLGNYDTLDYQFHANSVAVFVEPKFTWTKYTWQPYLLTGVGESWNHLSNYHEYPTDPTSTAAATLSGFSSYTQRQFAYEAGVGVQRELPLFKDYALPTRYYASLDYRYMSLGHAELGRATPNQLTNDRLTIPHLTTQAIVLSIKATV